jgi:gliding motility-associated-like protein
LTYWNDGGATSSLATPNAVSVGNTYFIQATNAGCTDIASVLVTINQTPNLVINNPAAVCTPLTVDLTAPAVTAGSTNPGILTYWTDAGLSISLASPGSVATGGIYYIQADNSGCTDVQSVNVTVNQTPNLVIIDPAAVCTPSSVDLTQPAVTFGSTNIGTLTYWSDAGATIPVAIPNGITVTNTYYIQASNAGCTDIAAVQVTVNSTPVLTISNPPAVCSPLTVDLTAPAVTSGSTDATILTYWADPAATSSLVSPSAISMSNVYYIQATNAGCTDIDPVTVTVNQTPNLIITDPAATCSPAIIDITAPAVTAGSTNVGVLTYWTDAAATSSFGSSTEVTVTNTYYIQANNAGCTDIEPVNVTINPLPTYNLTSTDPTVCNASDATITISGLTSGENYDVSYDDDGVAMSMNASADASGQIIITGVNAGTYDNFIVQIIATGCSAPNATSLNINNPGAPVLNDVANGTYCDVYTIPAITGTGLSGSQSYWTGSGATGTQIAAGTVINSSQTIFIYDISGTCSDEESFTVTINNTPQFTNPGDQVVCGSYTLTNITGTNLSGNEAYYTNPAGTGTVLLAGTAITTDQTIYVYGFEGNCDNQISFDVTVNALPTVSNVTGGSVYCAGDVIADITVDVTGSADWTVNYTLDGVAQSVTGSTSPLVLGNTAGVYVITDISDANCTNTASGTQTIIVNPIPGAPIAGSDSTYCSNWTLEAMTANGTGSFTWYSDASLTTVITTGSTLTPDAVNGSTTYYVTETISGCEGAASSVTITITECEIVVPTAFTPDNDNVNDQWEIVDLDEVYPTNVVYVYNRWGNLVYQSEKGSYTTRPWDGKFNGNELPVASYYFIIDLDDNTDEVRKGVISIIRK